MTEPSVGLRAAAARHRRHFLYRLDHLGLDLLRFSFDGRGGNGAVGTFLAITNGERVPIPQEPVCVPVTKYVFDATIGREVVRSGYREMSLPDALEVWAQEFIRAELPNTRQGYGLYGHVTLDLKQRSVLVACQT